MTDSLYVRLTGYINGTTLIRDGQVPGIGDKIVKNSRTVEVEQHREIKVVDRYWEYSDYGTNPSLQLVLVTDFLEPG